MNNSAAALTPEDIERWRARIRWDTEVNYLYCMGLALERSGATAEAETMISQALARDAHFAGARVAGIRLARQRGDSALATRLKNDGLELDPDFPLAAPLDLLRDIGDKPDALAALLPQIRAAVTDAKGVILRRRAREALGNTLETLAQEATIRGDDAAALAYLEETASLSGSPAIPVLLKLAQARQRTGDIAIASDIILKAWSTLGMQGNTHVGIDTHTLGMAAIYILRTALRLDEALHICDSLLSGSPRDPDLTIHKALLLLARRQSGDAVALLRDAVDRTPAHALLYTFFSMALAADGDVAESVATGRRAVELDATGPLGLIALGSALALAGQPTEGGALIARANAIVPVTDLGKTAEAVALWQAGNVPAARQAVAEALALPFPAGSGRHAGFLLRLRPYAEDFLTSMYRDLGGAV